MIAVFARRDHPNYNNGEWKHHGYVVALVRCRNEAQVHEVALKLMRDGLPEPYAGHASYEQGWYGGVMDLIAVLPGNKIVESKTGQFWTPVRPLNPKQSIGDNRYAGFYDAKELL